jgi:bacteriocin biosynthesis cyclodehydratase domain-containing protein
MLRPRIKRTTELIESPDGDLYLLRPSADSDICIERPDTDQRRLLALLDGSHERDELEGQFGAEAVGDVLAQLGELELVEDAADDDRLAKGVLARFDRQLRYFSDVAGPGLTPSECQARLEEATVAVIGVGGLGTWAAWALACCGVGRLRLIDGDRIEESNLNRQVLFMENDVGKMKVEVAAERLADFNSAARIETLGERLESEEEVADAIIGSDIVVDAADWPAHEIERWVNGACFGTGIPFITGSHFPPIARIGPLFAPGQTGCFACQESAVRRDYPLFDMAIEQRRAKSSGSAMLGPVCGFIGGQIGTEVMHHLTGLSTPSTLGVAHIYDVRTMELRHERIDPEPDCPVCGNLCPSSADERQEAASG